MDGYWSDIGTLEQYKQSTDDLFNGKCDFEHAPIVVQKNGSYICEAKEIEDSVKFIGNSTIGQNVTIGKNTTIENSIIWDDVEIAENIIISNSVIASGTKVRSDVISQIIGPNEVVNNEILKI